MYEYEQAKEYLARQAENIILLAVCRNFLDSSAIREADAAQTMQLIGSNPEEYAREKAKRFHQDLLEAYQRKIVVELTELLASSPTSLKKELNDYIKTNSKVVRATRLDYTAIPEHPVTLFFVELATVLGKLEDRPTPAINILLPGVFTFPELDESRPDLSLVDLAWVLKTHILHRSHRYLLPVSLITKETGNHNNIYNPYYTVNEDPEKSNATITPEDWSRLWHHSPQTETLKEMQQRYDLITHDKSTLLGQLTFLCEKFKEYGSHDGIGTAEKAAEPLFLVITQFFEYYDQLDKNKIPPAISKNVDTIREQLSDYLSETRKEYLTCVSTHRTALLPLIEQNKATLDTIGIDECKRQSEAEQQYEALKQAREKLVRSTECNANFNYKGSDPLGLTLSMLTTLQVSLRIQQAEDLPLLCCFTPEELIALASNNDDLINDVIRQLNTIENLVVFLSTKLPAGHIGAFFTVFYPKLDELLQLHNIANFRALTITLNPEKITAIFEAMKDRLPNIIKTGRDFGLVFQPLSAEQCTAAYAAIGDLSSIITAKDFKDTLLTLSPKQRTLVIEGIKQNLLTIIKTAHDCDLVLLHLSPEQRTLVFEGIKQNLLTMIKTARDCDLVWPYLSPEQRTLVFEGIKQNLPTMIKTARDCNLFLQRLSPEKSTEVCAAIGDLSSIITTAKDFNDALLNLSPEQCTSICSKIRNLRSIITNKDDFIEILLYLSPDQGTALCAAIGDFSSIITTAKDFNDAWWCLPPEKRTLVFFEGIKQNLPTMIKTAHDCNLVLQHLSPEQCTAACSGIGDHLLRIIKTEADFSEAFENHSNSENSPVLEGIQQYLNRINISIESPPQHQQIKKAWLKEAQRLDEINEKSDQRVTADFISYSSTATFFRGSPNPMDEKFREQSDLSAIPDQNEEKTRGNNKLNK